MVEVGKWYRCNCNSCSRFLAEGIRGIVTRVNNTDDIKMITTAPGYSWVGSSWEEYQLTPYTPTEAEVASYIAAVMTGAVE